MSLNDKLKDQKIVHKIIPVRITNMNIVVPFALAIFAMLFFMIVALSQYNLVSTDVLDKFCRLTTGDQTAKSITPGIFNKEVGCSFDNHIIYVSKYSKTKTNINKINNITSEGED